MDSRKKKGIIGGVTIFLAATLLIGGALTWTDFTQSRTNRFRGSVYYDATLHDDFDGENKDVYVENSGENTIYVRVRLDEYMQIGNTNMNGEDVTQEGSITSLDKDKWITHLYAQTEDGILSTAAQRQARVRSSSTSIISGTCRVIRFSMIPEPPALYPPFLTALKRTQTEIRCLMFTVRKFRL